MRYAIYYPRLVSQNLTTAQDKQGKTHRGSLYKYDCILSHIKLLVSHPPEPFFTPASKHSGAVATAILYHYKNIILKKGG